MPEKVEVFVHVVKAAHIRLAELTDHPPHFSDSWWLETSSQVAPDIFIYCCRYLFCLQLRLDIEEQSPRASSQLRCRASAADTWTMAMQCNGNVIKVFCY